MLGIGRRIAFLLTMLLASLQVEAAMESSQPDVDGLWLVQKAEMNGSTRLGTFWRSRLTISANHFNISNYFGTTKSVKGTFVVRADVNPMAVDLHIDPIDLSQLGLGVQLPAMALPAIFKLDGEGLTICFRDLSKSQRPTDFRADDNDMTLFNFVRANANFKDFPSNVTITILDPSGKPAAGASIFQYMTLWGKTPQDKPQWNYYLNATAGADGMVQMPYNDLGRFASLVARDAAAKLMGFTAVSPASLAGGKATIRLAPQCLVTGAETCDELAKIGKSIGRCNLELLREGRRFGLYHSFNGTFEFALPPGDYVLWISPENASGKTVSLTVPANQSTLRAAPISLTAAKLTLMEGRPAPELKGVVAWEGKPTKFADLRGKYVLVDFWGYWCEPCVESMPILIDLYNRFHDKGLAIIGVHVDLDGEINTAAKLDEKLAGIKKEYWHGQDLPFPNALVSGAPAGRNDNTFAPSEYGIGGYPTTLLIGRQGNLVGDFNARDPKAATAAIEKLLNR